MKRDTSDAKTNKRFILELREQIEWITYRSKYRIAD